MKKICTVAGIVIGTFIFTCIVIADDYNINTVTGLNVKFPSDWTSRRVSEYQIDYYPSGSEPEPMFAINNMFAINEEINDPPIEESEKESRYDDYVNTLEDCEVTDVSTGYIGDIEYRTYTYNKDMGDFGTITGKVAYIINDGNSTYLGYVCNASDVEANNALFEQLVSQITIIGAEDAQELPSVDTLVQNIAIEMQSDHAGTSAVSSDTEAITINFWDDTPDTDLEKIAIEKYNEAQNVGMHLRVNLLDPNNLSYVIEQYYDGVKTIENGEPVAPTVKEEGTTDEENTVSEDSSDASEDAIEDGGEETDSFEEIGEGTWYISNGSGTTAEWENLIYYVNGNNNSTRAPILSLGMFAKDLNGRLLSYIYIDGELISKEQLAHTQLSFSITDDQVSVGTHKVECKQYVDNDENGEIIFYRSAEYEVIGTSIDEENTISIDDTDVDEEIGEGTWYISNQSGTTEEGESLIVYVDSNDDNQYMFDISLGMYAQGLNGRLLSYIYIDGKLAEEEQLSHTSTSIYISDDQISVGTHKVECRQYADNDVNGEVLFRRSAEYEVVEK